jgi:hypothetical protein
MSQSINSTDFMKNIEISQLLLAGEIAAAKDLICTLTNEQIIESYERCKSILKKVKSQLSDSQKTCLSKKMSFLSNELNRRVLNEEKSNSNG